MKPTNIYINGRANLKEKDLLGYPIAYDKCKESTTGNYFLNIRSLQHFLGTYDIWKSKNGDTLALEYAEGKMVFEFSNGRFWLVTDYLERNKIREKFLLSYPDVEDIDVHDDYLVATTNGEEIRYLYKYKRGNLEFKELDRKVLPQQECLEGEIVCLQDCFYKEGKVCRYFDWNMERHCSEVPTCKDPFTYIESAS